METGHNNACQGRTLNAKVFKKVSLKIHINRTHEKRRNEESHQQDIENKIMKA